MLNGLLLAVVVLRGIFLWMILFLVILGEFKRENLGFTKPCMCSVTYYSNRHYISEISEKSLITPT